MALGNDDNYKILISTDADTRGVKATEAALKDMRGASDHGGSSFLKLSGAVAAGQAAFSLATSAIRGAVGFLGASVKASGEAEAAQKQLEHAVINVSKATQAQLKETENLADSLEKKGVLDGDNIKMGLAQLSTFGLSNKAVQGLAKSLSDLAVNQHGVSASGEQLSDTANMIAKALNGQFGVLEKSGIRFTQAQKDIIKYGTEMQKVDAINQGFAQNLKYTNDVALTTNEGKMAKLKVSFENAQEAIGNSVIKGFTPLMEKLATFVSSDKFQGYMNALILNLDKLWPMLGTVLLWAGKLFSFLSDNIEVLAAIAAGFIAIRTAIMVNGLIAAFGAMTASAGIAGAAIIAALPLAAVIAGVGIIIFELSKIISTYKDINRLNAETQKGQEALNKSLDATTAKVKGMPLDVLYKIQQGAGYTGKQQVYKQGNTYVGGYAAGTKSATAGVHLVGEQGPELVNFKGGESVMPADKTKRALEGKQVTFNQTNHIYNQVDLDAANRTVGWRLQNA